MAENIYQALNKAGVFEYGSNDLTTFEERLVRYFSREYKRHNGRQKHVMQINQGPLALAVEDLAERHYDQGIEFFHCFLDDKTMSYTMAYFGETAEEAGNSSLSLAAAQNRKFRLIAERMELSGAERVLNIGCGFGYYESFLLENYPSLRISATTHSRDQYEFLINRMKKSEDPLSSTRFKLFFGDVDSNSAMSWGKNQYDLVFSMGLLEQINNIELLFKIISELLTDSGRMFHHLIVSRDLIPQFLDPDKTLIGNYFPGGKVIPFRALQYDPEQFLLKDSWFINGMNYWKTLDKWHENFWKNLHLVYPAKMDIDRVRYWNNYFILCKAMFRPENGFAYGNGQYLYQKR